MTIDQQRMALTNMDETIQYKYTPEFAGRVYREFLLRKVGMSFLLMVLAFVYLIWALEGDKGFLWGVASTLVTIYVAGAIINVRAVAGQARSLSNSLITVTFNEDSITYDNVDHISIVKWRRIYSVTRLKNVWLFSIYNDNNYTAVPAALISDSIKALVEKKMAENHKSIK